VQISDLAKDVIWTNLEDLDLGSVGVDVVEKTPYDQRMQVIGAILSALKGYFGYSWGARLEYRLPKGRISEDRVLFYLIDRRST
jgi:hypothetical protein